jgi:hypothetical protein
MGIHMLRFTMDALFLDLTLSVKYFILDHLLILYDF